MTISVIEAGRRGGNARAKNLDAKQRSDIASKGGKARAKELERAKATALVALNEKAEGQPPRR